MKITVSSVPTTSEEFSALPQNDLSKPENTCAMFLLALALYLKDSDAGVAAPSTPLTLEVIADSRPHDIEEGYLRLFLKTTGADSPRPIKLRQKGDSWYLWEYSSILSGIRIPSEADAWT